MRAIAMPSYGPLTQLRSQELPVPQPGRGEVRVRVEASALNPADYKVLEGKMKFLHARNFPLVVGYDFSGIVEALGPGVSTLAVGDEVFGFLPYGPGNRRGAFAEALLANAAEVARKPALVSHATAAAAATPGMTALTSLRDLGRLPAGGSALITGASGGVGALAIGIARILGAAGVTALGSGRGLAMARRLGATAVIDRNSQDVFRAAQGPYDVVFDAAAAYRWSQWRAYVKPGGAYVTTLPSMSFGVDKLRSLLAGSRCELVMVKSKSADLELLGGWMAAGQLEVPLDSVLPIRSVAEGLGRLERGEVLGRLAVQVAGGF